MAFRTNNSKASEGNLKDEGYYEVIIDSAKVTQTPGGKQKIALKYIIRNDIQQKYHNGLIFHDVWKKTQPNEDDMAIGGFNFSQLMAISKAAKLPDGQEYADLGEFLNALVGKAVKVHLYHDPYNGKTYEKVDMHVTTDHPEIRHKPKEKPNTAGYAAPTAAQFANTAPSAPTEGLGAASADDDYPF